MSVNKSINQMGTVQIRCFYQEECIMWGYPPMEAYHRRTQDQIYISQTLMHNLAESLHVQVVKGAHSHSGNNRLLSIISFNRITPWQMVDKDKCNLLTILVDNTIHQGFLVQDSSPSTRSRLLVHEYFSRLGLNKQIGTIKGNYLQFNSYKPSKLLKM